MGFLFVQSAKNPVFEADLDKQKTSKQSLLVLTL
jgi:hypothetical protein